MALTFLRKAPAAGKGIVPTERVKELTAKGFSEIETIDILRKEGYSPEEIDKALTAALRAVVAGPPAPTAVPKPESKLPTLEDIAPAAKAEMPEIPETSLPEEYAQTYPTEEYIDYLIRERVSEVDQKINEISYKTQELERRLNEIREQINELVKAKASGETAILTKIDTFKETVTDVNTRLGGLEKAFKETLPALIESVRALSDLVQRLKREA